MSTERGLSRTEAEKLGRMAECWRADRFSGEEVTSAMHRWSYRRHAPRLPSLRQVLLLVAAGSLSTGGALALSGALHLPGRAELQRDGADAPAGKARVQRKPRVYWELGGQRVEPHGESHVELGPGETLTWVVDDARTELSGPGVVKLSRTGPEQGWVAAFRPRGSGDGWAASASPPPPAEPSPEGTGTSASPPASATSSAASDPWPHEPRLGLDVEPFASVMPRVDNPAVRGAWSRAADALRVGDGPAAAQALDELAANHDPVTRDAARLAKAQLDASHGRWSVALPVLQRLARSGATPLLRRRAREVIDQRK